MTKYQSSPEFISFLEDRFEFECGCCHRDIENEASEDVKKRISENIKSFPLELFICPECVKDKRCRSIQNRPHPHTDEGRKWVFESIKESKEYLYPGSTENFPAFENWIKDTEFEQ